MKKFFLLLLALPLLNAVETDKGENDREMAALRQWITSKRMVTVKERGGNFALSGDVRAKFGATNEVEDGINQRGRYSANPNIPFNEYNIETNLMYDYRTDYTWVTIKLKYNNIMGTFNGTVNKLALDRAFLGFRFLEGRTYTTDLEIGRRKLGYTFDSKVQYGTIMDGILLKFNTVIEKVGDFYLYGGPFVTNQLINQYSWVVELGGLNLFSTGLYTKLSAIDWNTGSQKTHIETEQFRFFNVQSLWGYRFIPTIILPKKITLAYAAATANLAARNVVQTNNELENWAWYAGFAIGEIRQKGDWAIDINYQWVQAQAISGFDMDGIGRGTAKPFYATVENGKIVPTTSKNAVGQCNFKGWQFELIYLISNTITISQTFKSTVTLDKNIGPDIKYKQYRLEFIYAF
ncbi:MAG: hypothetical protein FJZ56_00745 [Chlamydiae bacterium]|nr:hypothetical protein [Chlamydiota bacterium]